MRFIAYYDRPNLSAIRRLIGPLSTLATRGHAAFFKLESSLQHIETANYHLIFLPNWSYRGRLPQAQGLYVYDLSDPDLLQDDNVLNVIGQCHAVTVPSEGLASVVRPFRSHVRVVPSLVTADLFMRAQPLYGPEDRRDAFVACFGDHDWGMIAEPLQNALRQLPNTIRVLTDDPALKDRLGDRALLVELSPQMYPRLVRSCFLGLLPRVKDDHDPIWAYEMGLCGMVCIGSPAYRQAILHQDTGFIAASSDQWTDLIVKVATSDAIRTRLGREAQAHARQFTTVRGADAWLKSISKFLP